MIREGKYAVEKLSNEYINEGNVGVVGFDENDIEPVKIMI